MLEFLDCFNDFEKRSLIFELSDYDIVFNGDINNHSTSILVRKKNENRIEMFDLYTTNRDLNILKKCFNDLCSEILEAFEEELNER